MRIYVINLERSFIRREQMRQQMDTTGLPYEFFSAVDGKAGDHLSFPQYSIDRCRESWRRPLAPGEVGCFASHYLLWKRCIEDNEPIVVIEDDVELSSSFAEAVALVLSLKEYDYVRLAGISTNSPVHSLPSDAVTGWRFVRFLRGPMGTQCYILFPGAARRLVAKASVWVMPVDNFLDAFWQHDVPTIGLLPFTASQKEVSSDIRDLGGFSDPVPKPMRFAVRLLENTRRLAWNLTALLAGR